MAPRLCFIACDYLYPEMKAAVEAEGLIGVEVRSFPARCGHPPLKWQELIGNVDKSAAESVELFGCYCLQELESPAPDFSHCRVNRLEQCFHLLCSQTLVSALQQEGAYLLTPGWLARWQQHVADWGFDRWTAVEFFGQSLSRLLLLDTGIDEHAAEHLDEFGSFLDLPTEILPIGLDFHRLALAKVAAGYQRHDLEREKEKALRHSADSAMALDLLGRVTRASSETEVIEAFNELFTMLLAPEKILHVRVSKTALNAGQLAKLAAGKRRQVEEFHSRPDLKYQLNESGDSFLLRIGRGEKVSAILWVLQVAFPKHIHHYLNVAIRVSEVCALAIEHARTMEKLLDTSRLAGKAEVATEVLHNVGNTLNSISVSSEQIWEIVRKSSSRTLPGIVDLIQLHTANIGDFISQDPRGKKLPAYFIKLSEQLTREQEDLSKEINRQLKHIRLVAEIIRTQQDSTKGHSFIEAIDLVAIVEECLLVFEQKISERRIVVTRDYANLPTMDGERHKLLQVITNLIGNALDAFEDMETKNRRLVLRLYSADDQTVVLEVDDNGRGMSDEILKQIFVFGFSTKKDGHGFGLHNGANLATEMGGTLTAESPGEGKGTILRLRLPVTV
ncbi:MAG: ATP-binding protein [Thermodesulfobacteriota bacterium]